MYTRHNTKLIGFIVGITLLTLPVSALAAIAYDNSSSSTTTGAGSITFSLTVGSGSNRILWVGAFCSTGDNVTGITYATIAMTQAAKYSNPAGGYTYWYYLVAPASGANNVVVTGASCSGGRIEGHALSYTGASQTGIPDASGSNTGNPVVTLDTSVTVVAANSWAIQLTRFAGSSPFSFSSCTQRTMQAPTGSAGTCDSNADLSAGSHTLTANQNTGNEIDSLVVSFAPAAGGGSTATSIIGLVRAWWAF